ncbi:MAG TPA: ATP-dependent DNA helicase RecG [Gaiellales bacterium]|jgi:ATP-dependent DNA helicase RecG|nr:ATP-dependent DNA helicase RecG [Gaiellales bacterium]
MTFAVPARERPKPRSAPDLERLAVAVEVRTQTIAAALAKRGIRTAGDLLETPPRAWRDYSEGVVSLSDVVVGAEATVRVELVSVHVRPTRRRNLRIVEAAVRDDSGAATAIWFNQGFLARTLLPGQLLQLRATVRAGRGLELTVREHEVLAEAGEGLHTSGVVAVYDASKTLSTRVLRELVEQALPRTDAIADPLPVGVRIGRRLPLRRDAIAALHSPLTPEDAKLASDRLAYEELLLLQVALAERRAGAPPAPSLGRPGELLRSYHASLPFTLTTGQKRSVRDIDRDLARGGRPMRRLLLGDVGSGKTVVAVHAMLRAAEHGAQAALLAPTEVLVQQHAATVRKLVEPLGVEVAVITGDLPAAERRVRLQRIASGDAALVVGTHALLESSVEFAQLSVMVVDEQHRFGVEQRAALSEGHGAHALHMTATPIPRSLALSLYGDLDLTELRELPAGRQPIITRVVRAAKRDDCHGWLIREWLEHRRQAYVVCALVEGSATVQARAAEELHAELVEKLAPLTVGLVHGRQKAAERAATMRAFVAAEVHVLVATTVIEVGIDVANATAMVIEDADRFGLSQLHQLRGRVGRGSDQSYCFLFESPEPGELGQRRLQALCEHASGFDLAELDLRMRGEGELAGLRQSGASDLRHASLARHRRLVARSRADARFLERAGPFDPVLAQAARERFGALVERIGRA